MKHNKKILLLLLIISVLSFNTLSLKPKADSGWDSSYDSGSWDSWDSGSSWSSDSDWGYSSGNYSGSGDINPISFIIIMIIIITIIIIVSKNNGSITSSSRVINNIYSDVSDDILNKYGIDKASFKKMVYEKYVDIQKAWMEFDYTHLRDNLTDELYNSYIMQLDALKIKNQKNIMSNFEPIDTKIISIKEENGLVNVNVYLRVEMYDYVVDSDNKVLRGSSNRKIDIEYIITFVKTTKEVHDTICPNCGAKIDATTGGKCEYCGTVIVIDAKDYVMSKKSCIGQRSK